MTTTDKKELQKQNVDLQKIISNSNEQLPSQISNQKYGALFLFVALCMFLYLGTESLWNFLPLFPGTLGALMLITAAQGITRLNEEKHQASKKFTANEKAIIDLS